METFKNTDLLCTDQMINLNILEIGHAFLDKHWNYQNVSYSFSQIYIPIYGEAQFLYNDQSVTLMPGYIYIVPAGLQYSCRCNGNMEKYMIDFSLSKVDHIDLLTGKNLCYVLKDTENFISRIQQIYQQSDIQSSFKLRSLIYEILDRLFSEVSITTIPLMQYQSSTTSALQYINQHLSAKLTIGQISDALFISRITLQKHFLQDVGLPMGKYIDERIMAIAERHLMEHHLSIHEISDLLGFCDQFYFSRRFKQHFSLSPKEYRKRKEEP